MRKHDGGGGEGTFAKERECEKGTEAAVKCMQAISPQENRCGL